MKHAEGIISELVCYAMIGIVVFGILSLSLGSRAMIDLALR